jgi:hypothetical protein
MNLAALHNKFKFNIYNLPGSKHNLISSDNTLNLLAQKKINKKEKYKNKD